MQLDEVDRHLPWPQNLALGMQHVLVMYAGAVTVPLILGGALKLPADQVAVLVNADLFCCGVVSIIQSAGLGRFLGIRLPVMMGVSFVGVSPMIAIAQTPGLGLPGLYGAIIAAGLICLLLAPWMSRLRRLFPPLVTGTALLVLGVSLLAVAVTWVGGGAEASDFGSPFYLGTAGLVMLTTLLVSSLARGFLANMGVLAGLLAGMGSAFLFGRLNFADVVAARWLDIVRPLQFGIPKFDAVAILSMTLVVLVAMVESIGMFFSLADIVGRDLDQGDFRRGLRADALGSAIGGLFNTFPYTSYSQNIGLVALTGVRSRFVCVTGGGILVFLSLIPKAARFVAAIPHYVLGGATVMMFGLVAASGLRILQGVDFQGRRHNGLIFAISLGVGLIPTLSPHLFQAFPSDLAPLLHSGVLLSILVSMALNAAFNGFGRVGS